MRLAVRRLLHVAGRFPIRQPLSRGRRFLRLFVREVRDPKGHLGPDTLDNLEGVAEGFLGTEIADDCSDTAGVDDAWPSDFDKSKKTDIFDVLEMKPFFNSKAWVTGAKPYSARLDLDVNSTVDIFDVLALKPVFNVACT